VSSRADPQDVQLLKEETLDPNKTYRWVQNSPLQIAKRSTQGYELVSRTEDEVETLLDNTKAPDDYIYNGDSVLMCCSKSLVKARRSRTSRIANDRLGAPVTEFKTEHQRSGARNSKVLIDEEGE
jgi:hypothetical protein